ncbi:TPA: recombinase RecT [Escherichia coli]|nr:recombinase RecT [Escherichia coli]
MSNDVKLLIDRVNKEIITYEEDFTSVLSDCSISFQREIEYAKQAFSSNPSLCATALNNKVALRSAIINVSAIGITLNPASKLAYLIPRKGAVCLDISYRGLVHIAMSSGVIEWCQAHIFRENDHFELQGVCSEPIHRYSPFASVKERGEIKGVYCVAKTKCGDFLTTTMRIDEVNEIMERSTSFIAWQKDNSKLTPWVTDYEEMVKKTVIKRGAKTWGSSDRLSRAVDYINNDADEGISFNNYSGGVTIEGESVVSESTPMTESQFEAIDDLLFNLGQQWGWVIGHAVKKYEREISSPEDITKKEADEIIAGLNSKLNAEVNDYE